MTGFTIRKESIVPPKGMLIALAAQLPLLVADTPHHPGTTKFLIGSALLLAGIALNVWADRLFKANGVGVCPFAPAPVVITSGPYRWTRNPMYLGLICLNLAPAFMTGVTANVWSSIAFFIWLHYAFVLPEEEFLRAEFGDWFVSYARSTPRWLLW